jgi:hypothetical protein
MLAMSKTNDPILFMSNDRRFRDPSLAEQLLWSPYLYF